MSEKDKNNPDFQFIQEEVIEKKHKKLRKLLSPLLMTTSMAILFGIIAAGTFVIAEPELFKYLHKEEDNKIPITFPTPTPDISTNENDGEDLQPEEVKPDITPIETQEPTVVVESIDADIHDFAKMYDEIKKVAYKTNKSLVKVSSSISGTDWMGNSVKQTIDTTGVVIYNNSVELLVLVSLDRVKGAHSINIVFDSMVEVEAVLKDYETEINLAVIAVKLEDMPEYYRNNTTVINFGQSYTLTVGSPIIALGNPNGYLNSLDIGVITNKGNAVGITDNRLDVFYTSIQSNSNADGIIIDLNGDLIGIITRTLKTDKDKELCTVLGISKVSKIIERLSNQTPRIYCGIKAEDMTDSAKAQYEVTNGIFVNEVLVKSPAFNAEIKNGDVILQVDDQLVVNTNGFYNLISEHKAGEEVTITVMRVTGSTKKEIELKVVLDKKDK